MTADVDPGRAPHPATGAHDHDVLLLGATGITGRIALAYLARRTTERGVTFAVGARDTDRVRQLCREAGFGCPPVFEVDASDAASLSAFAARGRVLINLVGPYTPHGDVVVRACVEAGTSYVDLTGETQFLRRTDENWHDRALSAGVAIVQTSGFEALPADLAVELGRHELAELGERLVAADVRVSVHAAPGARMSDAVSGGTARSILAVLADRESPRLGDIAFRVGDARDRDRVRAVSPLRLWPRAPGGRIVVPMVPAAFINSPVVHRTAWLLARESGEPFAPLRYREGVPFGTARRPKAAAVVLAAQAQTIAQAAAIGVGMLPWPVRLGVSRLLARLVPAAGTGPQGPALEEWRWELTMRGVSNAGRRVSTHIAAVGHPGYSTTARMISELALILADGSGTGRPGCITPALAVGAGSASRFASAGMRFSVRSSSRPEERPETSLRRGDAPG